MFPKMNISINQNGVIEALKAEVETHRNGAELNDDLTMMCLRVDD